MNYFSRLRLLQRPSTRLALLTLMAACGGGGSDIVKPSTAVTAVSVSPGSVPLQGVGATASVSATLTPSTASSAITWRTGDPSIATVSGSGNSATVTAVGGGTTTVIAAAGSVTGSATVTVTPIVRAIGVSAPTAAVLVGGTTRITTTFTADPGASQAVQWTTSAATIATVDATGTITGVTPGNATITVASTAFPSVTATVAVTVSYPVVAGVTVNPSNPTVILGATRQMSATVDAASGVSSAVTWTSATPAVATVSATGLVAAVSAGTTIIRATSVANPTVSGTTVVTAAAPTVRAVTLLPSPTTVAQGNSRQLTATVDADAGANTALTWSTTDGAVATVNSSGLVTGVSPGTATVRATSVLVPSVSAAVIVSVTAPPPLLNWVAQPTTPPASLLNWYMYGAYSLANGTAWGAQWLNSGDRRMLRYDGTNWITVDAAPFDRIYSVGGFGNSAWIGSVGGRLAQLVISPSGEQTWATMNSPTTSLVGRIIGISATTAVAATYERVLVLNNGVWSLLPVNAVAFSMEVSDIAATALDNIVVTMYTPVDGSRVRRWNGTLWTAVDDPPIGGELRAVKFRGTDIVVANNLGQSAAYNGTSWTTLSVPASRSGAIGEFIGSIVNCGGQLYSSTYNGGRVFRLSGATWTVIADYGVAVAGSSNGDVSCGGDGVLRSTGGWGGIGRYTGSGWINELTSARISRIVLLRPDLAWASGGQGRIMRWDGTRWTLQFSDATTGEAPDEEGADDTELRGLGVAVDGTVMATRGSNLGQAGAIYRRTTSGAWVTDITSGHCDDVWVASSSFALAVGQGCGLRWNGSTWQQVSGLPPTPMSVAGSSVTNALAVGADEAISASALWNGTVWTPVNTPNVGALRSVRMVSATVAYALGERGILRWDGTQWSTVTVPIDLASVFPLRAISVNSANEVYVITSAAALWRFNGTTWEFVLTVSNALGDASLFGPRSLATIPGYGIVGTGSGFLLHASSSGAVRAGISIPGLRMAPAAQLLLTRNSKDGPTSARPRPPKR